MIHGLSNWAAISHIAWSAKGETIVAACQDRTVRFWDAATAQLRGVLLCDPSGVVSVMPDGHYKADQAATEADLVYVVLTEKGQDTLPPAKFAAKYKWKNQPNVVKLTN